MDTFPLEIITPARKYPAIPVTGVDVAAPEGRLTILVRHQPLICLVQPGRLKVTHADGRREEWPGGAGVMTVTPERVTLLLETVTIPD